MRACSEHVRDEQLGLRVEADLPHGLLARTRRREPAARHLRTDAEVAQIERRLRCRRRGWTARRARAAHLATARRGQRLRTLVHPRWKRREAGIRLHPGERANEAGGNAEAGRPRIETVANLSRRRCAARTNNRNPVRLHERPLGARSHDPVGNELVILLEATHRPLRPRAEISVERTAVEAALAQEELDRGNIEAEIAALDRPVAEQRSPERSERATRAGVDRAGDR